MKKMVFFIMLLTMIYLASCVTFPPTFEEKATATGITIIRSSDEKKPIMKELLSKCIPTGKIEQLPAEQNGDYVINKALNLGANVVHIYYAGSYSEKKSDAADYGPKLHYVTRFWICKQPIGAKDEK
ncbi:MAG: hypothetical protein FWG92_07540 [Leptospirales bacterium]|nr:hypothetical protein [Leptospirales bacterium]